MTKFGETQKINPVQLYVEFKSGGEWPMLGKFYHWDKSASENVSVDLGEFIILKTAYTVSGYSDKYQSGIYSNTVEYLNEILEVQTYKKDTIALGLYKEIKWDLLSAGAKLNKVLYIYTEAHGIVYLKLKGSASWAISEFLKVVDMNKMKIKIAEVTDEKKWATKYKVPVFGMGAELTEDDIEIAKSKLAFVEGQDIKDEEVDTFVDDLLDETNKQTESVSDSNDDLPF